MNASPGRGFVHDTLIHDIVATGEALLSQRFGGNQVLTEVKVLSGSGNAVVFTCPGDAVALPATTIRGLKIRAGGGEHFGAGQSDSGNSGLPVHDQHERG